MIKELIHDPMFLAGKSAVATIEDLQVAKDLLDTLIAHRESCVGMAANMIGVHKRIIAFVDDGGKIPDIPLCLTLKLLKKRARMRRKKAVYHCLVTRASASVIKTLKCSFKRLK